MLLRWLLCTLVFARMAMNGMAQAHNSTVAARIVNGRPVRNRRYPYVLSLQRGGEHKCGGSLIACDVVLTAAHCHGLVTHAQTQDGDIIKITKQAVHPLYNANTHDNDFLLLRLERLVWKTPLLHLNTNPRLPTVDTPMTVMGWGTNVFGKHGVSDSLDEVTLDYLTNEQCLERTKGSLRSYENILTSNMLCANEDGRGPCQGDSGSPLILAGSNASQDVQVGITSWGVGCALAQYPGAYARISAGYRFLQSYTCRLSRTPPAYLDCTDSQTLQFINGTSVRITSPTIVNANASQQMTSIWILIRTDGYPKETAWNLKDTSGNLLAEVSFGSLEHPASLYVVEYVVPEGIEYIFTLMDGYGDGICCDFGPGRATVFLNEINYNSILVFDDGMFQNSRIHKFIASTDGIMKLAPDDPVIRLVDNGTFPIAITLELLEKENQPEQLHWVLERIDLEEKLEIAKVPLGSYQAGQQYEHVVHVPQGGLYQFVIQDNGHDGFLGFYQLYLGTNNTFDFNDINATVSLSGAFLQDSRIHRFVATENDNLPMEGDGRRLTVEIQFDRFPYEQGWFLLAEKEQSVLNETSQSSQFETIAFGPKRATYGLEMANQLYTETIVIPEIQEGKSQRFKLIWTDVAGDGICCIFDDGYIRLWDGPVQSKDGPLVQSSSSPVYREVLPFELRFVNRNQVSKSVSPFQEGEIITNISIWFEPLGDFPESLGWRITDERGTQILKAEPGLYVKNEKILSEASVSGFGRDSKLYLFELFSTRERQNITARYTILVGDTILAEGDGNLGKWRYHHFSSNILGSFPLTACVHLGGEPGKIGWNFEGIHVDAPDTQYFNFTGYTQPGAIAVMTAHVPSLGLYRWSLLDSEFDLVDHHVVVGSANGDGGEDKILSESKIPGSVTYVLHAANFTNNSTYYRYLDGGSGENKSYLSIEIATDHPLKVNWAILLGDHVQWEQKQRKRHNEEEELFHTALYSYGPILLHDDKLEKRLQDRVPVPLIKDQNLTLVVFSAPGVNASFRLFNETSQQDFIHGRVDGFAAFHTFSLPHPSPSLSFPPSSVAPTSLAAPSSTPFAQEYAISLPSWITTEEEEEESAMAPTNDPSLFSTKTPTTIQQNRDDNQPMFKSSQHVSPTNKSAMPPQISGAATSLRYQHMICWLCFVASVSLLPIDIINPL